MTDETTLPPEMLPKIVDGVVFVQCPSCDTHWATDQFERCPKCGRGIDEPVN